MVTEEILAIHPSALLAALRRFLQSRMRSQGAGGHPLIALRRRLVWVDDWETERLGRESISEIVRESWRRQAAHWRADARFAAGVLDRWALQIQSHDGHWRSLAPAGQAEVWIDAATDLASVTRTAWERCGRILGHIQMLDQLGAWVAEPDADDIPTVVGNICHW